MAAVGQITLMTAYQEAFARHSARVAQVLLDADDPLLSDFETLQAKGACRLVVYDDVGMEGTAQYVFEWVSAWVSEATAGRVQLEQVECRENDKNSAIYRPA